MKQIPVCSLKENLKSNTLLIDVRSKSEHDAGAIPESICIPVESVADFRDTFSKYDRVVLYCNSGTRAKMAAGILSGVGVTNVFIAEGGFPEWRNAGHEVLQKNRSSVSLQRQVFLVVGSAIILSFVLDQIFPGARYVSAFFGAGLLFAGATDKCLLGMLLAKLPWNKNTNTCLGGKTCETQLQ